MFASLRARLWASYLLLTAVILFVVTLALLVFLARNPRLTREAENNLIFAANALQRERLSIPAAATIEDVQAALRRADDLLDVRVAVFNPDGSLLADSRADSEAPIPDLNVGGPQGRGQPSPGLPGEVAEFTDADGQVWLYNLRQTQNGFTLMVATPRPSAPLLGILTDEFFPPIMRAGLIGLALSILLGALIARSVSAPLRRMSSAAEAIAEGELSQVKPEGPREVRALAASLNEMSERVHNSQQSQRDFVANVSHELKTPITSIQGFAQAILDGTVTSGGALQQAAQVIFDEAGRMHRLVVDLLELARLDAGTVPFNRDEVNLAELLAGVAQKFQPLAQEAEVTLETKLEDLPILSGDADRLVQVFTNLTENALKHTPAGGRVTVAAVAGNGAIEASVADTGPGIPPNETSRIFERFYQVDKSRAASSRRGVGLGLPIAQQIVRAHGGTLTVESQVGQGARFIVRLPLEGKP